MRHLMQGYNTNVKQGQKLKNTPGPIQYQSPQLTHGSKMQNPQTQSASQLQPIGLGVQGGFGPKHSGGLPNMGSNLGSMLNEVHHSSHQVLPNNMNYINTNMMPNTSTSKNYQAI